MTDEQWDTFAMLLDKGFKWREAFGPAHEFTYRTVLDGYDPEQIATALRTLVVRGQVFGPTPGEIVEVIRRDPGLPTAEEMLELLCGRGGVLRARPAQATFADGRERDHATDRAAVVRADELHPLLGRFVRQEGVERLRMLPLADDGEDGMWARKGLCEAWGRLCEAMEGREVAALASGDRVDGLRRLDPLAGLVGPRRQIEAGAQAAATAEPVA